MLNELLIIEKGARQSDIEICEAHRDIKDVKKVATLRVLLGENRNVSAVEVIPKIAKLWTLRDGNHNSFPFIQTKIPFLKTDDPKLRAIVVDKTKDNKERREALNLLISKSDFNKDALKIWPSPKFLKRLWDRLSQLSILEGQNCIVWATFDRILRFCDPKKAGDSKRLFKNILELLIRKYQENTNDDWFEIAAGLLIGKEDKKNNKWVCDGAFIFEADGFPLSIYDPRLKYPVSKALADSDATKQKKGDKNRKCALTGESCKLISGNFPQPNLRVLGQTYIFSKNKEIRANDRYSRFASDAMPLGEEIASKLAGALTAISSPERENKTWRKIPGEAPKQTDLLIAYVEKAIDVPIVENLAEDNFFEEEIQDPEILAANSVAIFEKRTERLIETIRAKTNADIGETDVKLSVFRKVDPANRKVVYSNTHRVTALENAAKLWIVSEKNVPSWIKLPIIIKGRKVPSKLPPQHISPLGLIAFSKQIFIRCGTERQELPGLPASEVFRFFLDSQIKSHLSARILRLIIDRRASLLINVAHIEHTPRSWRYRRDIIRKNNHYKSLNRECLKTVTAIGVVLFKYGRTREAYMNDTAFKLGQLLAAADIVHAGYCADVRGGDIPPSLLGNQFFVMAQHSPAKALAALCRRWKPYDGWTKKIVRDQGRIQSLMASDQERGWDIKKALRNAREMRSLAKELTQNIKNCQVNDEFRAELLLGYVAGLPKAKEEGSTDQINSETISENGGD